MQLGGTGLSWVVAPLKTMLKRESLFFYPLHMFQLFVVFIKQFCQQLTLYVVKFDAT